MAQDVLNAKTIIANEQRKANYANHKQELDALRDIWEIAGDPDKAADYAASNTTNRKDFADVMNKLTDIRINPDAVIVFNPTSDRFEWGHQSSVDKWNKQHPDQPVQTYQSTDQAQHDLASQYDMPNPSKVSSPMRVVISALAPRTGTASGLFGADADDEMMQKHPPKARDLVADAAEDAITGAVLPMSSGHRLITRMANNAIPVLVGRTGGRVYDELSGTPDIKKASPAEIAGETGLAAAGGLVHGLIGQNFPNIERKKLLYKKLESNRAANAAAGNKLPVVDLRNVDAIPNDVLRAADKGMSGKEFVNDAYKGINDNMPVSFKRIPVLTDMNDQPLARLPETHIDDDITNHNMVAQKLRSSDADQPNWKQLYQQLMNRSSRASQLYQPTKAAPYKQSGTISMRDYANDIYKLSSDTNPFQAQLMRDRVQAATPADQTAFDKANAEYNRRMLYSPALEVGHTDQYKRLLPITNKRRATLPDNAKDSPIKSGFNAARNGAGYAADLISSEYPNADALSVDKHKAKKAIERDILSGLAKQFVGD